MTRLAIFILCVSAATARAQKFEVASIKPSAPDEQSVIYHYAGARLRTTGTTMKNLIREAAAIALALAPGADLLLMDDRRGVAVAVRQGLRVTGTLGLLDLAADRGLVNFAEVIRKLELTSFRRPDALLKSLLTKYVTGDALP